jgi:hypothetical protein
METSRPGPKNNIILSSKLNSARGGSKASVHPANPLAGDLSVARAPVAGGRRADVGNGTNSTL